MAGVSAQGGTFTFRGIRATITGLSVETPTAEVVDMTSYAAPINTVMLVPTGAWSGGSVTVDYVHQAGGVDPQTVVRQVGQLVFGSPGYSITRQAILESATTEARLGDRVTGSLRFRLTDYYQQ